VPPTLSGVNQRSAGTVTFLFTDLEGSTRLWEDFPDAMQDALARHDALLRDAILAGNGRIVKMRGDGVHAVFGSAHDALGAAAGAQRAISAEPWGVTGPLRVRIGVHTGDAELREGDYYGTAVNRAARLMDAASGGQILVSLATEELARDTLDHGLEFVDLGEHRLRNLARAERVFQLAGPGLPDDVEPPTWLDVVPGNLPLQVTSFVGREDAVVEIAGAVRTGPLVTITGTGGVGKTRLALQIAGRMLDDYRDGAWICELGVANEEAEAIQVIATSLGVTPRPGMSLEASIVEFLRTKQLLLVLDNCEHLLEVSARFAERVIRGCPDVRVLATSREGLAVHGEQIRPLRSLTMSASDAPDDAAPSDATLLFVDRASAARPGFSVDSGNSRAIAEICRRLDGIPLAIELAAARVVSMNPDEIVTLLDERFRLLTGGRRGAVERHQTLRAAVEWSYSLLTAVEQRVFARLSVFSGSFSGTDATAVVTGDGVDTWDAIETIGGLVTKSMVNTDEAPDGSMRYRLLETLRQFALDRLADIDDPDAWRRRHAVHFAEFAELAGNGFLGSEELAWRPRTMIELDNLRIAVAWSLDRGDHTDRELAIRIVAGLSNEANAGSSLGVGSWSERALPFVDATTPERRAAVLSAASWNALFGGDLELARDRAHAVLGIEPRGFVRAATYVLLSYIAAIQQDYNRVAATLAEGLAVTEADEGDHALVSRVTLLMASAGMRVLGGDDSPEAQRTADEALRAARESGHPTSIANALFVSVFGMWRTDPARAAAIMDESIALVRRGASGVVFGLLLAVRAVAYAEAGDHDRARAHLRESIAFSTDRGDSPTVATAVDYGIQVMSALGELDDAAVFAGAISTPQLSPIDSLPARERTRRDDALARTRAALGDEAYEALFARGAAMSFDEVCRYVVRALET
jgi:predicted ATPase/class 3 adenylate cyclase